MEILKIFENKLRLKNYSVRTIDTYCSYVKRFLIDLKITDPYQLRTSQMVNYLENYKYCSIEQQNQIINSLKV